MTDQEFAGVITIDGPAGSGKSTIAKQLAVKLGIQFLDTGAMYRAVALACLQNQISLDNSEQIQKLLPHIDIRFLDGKIYLNRHDVSNQIRTAELAAAASKIAILPMVRSFLNHLQREIGRNRKIVTEGRDQGTAVFPQARFKFFLIAAQEVRAQRRWLDLQSRGQNISFAEVLAEQIERDHRDTHREIDPLQAAKDAITLDTSSMTTDEVLHKLIQEINRCLPH